MVAKNIIKSSFLSLCFLTSSAAMADDWQDFQEGIKQHLMAANLDVAIFEKAMEGVKAPSKKVKEKLVTQPESTFTFADYKGRMVSDFRINKAQEKLEKFKADFDKVEAEYGIPREVIASLWGIESVFGEKQGQFKIIPALATLAYDSHRKDFFQRELVNAVKIVDEGHIPLENLTGSWAGAMGQCQFMPSSFFRFAADGNNDGRKDIWQTEVDVFASASNYLEKSGWVKGANWGEAVTLTKYLPKFEISERGLSEPKTLKEWYDMGIAHKYMPPKKWRKEDRVARLFMPDGPSKRVYLVYENFDVILKWNRSSYFAFSVLNLADRIAGKKDL